MAEESHNKDLALTIDIYPMRILASAILLGLALNFPLTVKAETKGIFNRNTEIKLKNKIDIMKNDIDETKNDNQETDLKKSKIFSISDNFVASAYIVETASVRKKTFGKSSTTKKYILPVGDFAVNASAYTAAADECGKSDGITASGIKVHRGTLACPPSFPFGTKLNIDGMGNYVCEDRGGAIKGNHVDIYMPTKKEAFAFGRRNLIATVIE